MKKTENRVEQLYENQLSFLIQNTTKDLRQIKHTKF